MTDEMIRRIEEARAALAEHPDDPAARMRLAEALRMAGNHAAALNYYATILTRDPANREALRGAAECAAADGDQARADGYRRLLRALDLASGADDAPPEGPPGESGSGDTDAAGTEEATPGADRQDESGIGFLRRPRLRLVQQGAPVEGDVGVERPSLTLADVAGMETVKRRLHVAFLAPLRNPKLRKMYRKSLRGGLLLYGPPGCGKTFIARATAGELGAKFVSVGLSDVLDMWLGESERKLHEIFQTARKNVPSVVFFDELDAIGQKRSQLRGHGGRNVVNQLLSELDGVNHDNDAIFVLGATNHPWDVDTALLRPGRFDRMVLVLPPDEPAREAILRFHLKERPVASGLDLRRIAAGTQGFSGADLAHLCETATELAMEASAAGDAVRPISAEDFKQALKEVRPSTRPWFDIARNYAMFANEGGVYDELLAYMRSARML